MNNEDKEKWNRLTIYIAVVVVTIVDGFISAGNTVAYFEGVAGILLGASFLWLWDHRK